MNRKLFSVKTAVAQKLSRTVMIAIVAIFMAGVVNAQKPKLAVMDFMAGVGLYQNDVNGLSDMLINSLFNTGRFELIERGQLCELIGETNLQKSSLSAGQLQQLAIKGVNFLLLGTANLTGGEYNIDVRVVDVGTGQLYSTAGVTKLSGQTYRDMMPKLANELAEKLPQTVKATVTVIPAPQPQTQPQMAYVYADDVFKAMPEYIEMQNVLESLKNQLQNEIAVMQNDYYNKVRAYNEEQDNLTTGVKLAKQKELEDINNRVQQYYESAQKQMEDKQNDLFKPIQEKLMNAIQAVGSENGYSISDANSIYYKSGLIDATPLVKRKLGILIDEK